MDTPMTYAERLGKLRYVPPEVIHTPHHIHTQTHTHKILGITFIRYFRSLSAVCTNKLQLCITDGFTQVMLWYLDVNAVTMNTYIRIVCIPTTKCIIILTINYSSNCM